MPRPKKPIHFSRLSFRLALVALFLAILTRPATAQQIQATFSKDEKQEVLLMLDTISKEIEKHYYDPKLRGIDWDANVQKFRERIENATSLNRGLSEVAAALDALDDSHTFFIPPPRPFKHDFGWHIAMVGDKCLVLAVRPQSDAATKGVEPGDQVLAINGFNPQRGNLWKMNFVFNALRPQPVLRVSLLSPAGRPKNIDLVAAIRELPKIRDLTAGHIYDYIHELQNDEDLTKTRYAELNGNVLVIKMPEFLQSEMGVDSMMKKARHKDALILDLRGNPGGRVDTLDELVRNLFDHDVKICDRVTRENSKPQTAKSMGRNAFRGKLYVLVDSGSASASEVFAKVVQLEKRGLIIGDRTAGAVMEARQYPYHLGLDMIVPYGASITDADLLMSDGKSLEKVGVIPDQLMLPVQTDLAAGRDTVLARAVELAGGKITPEEANKLFPVIWPSK